MHCPSAPLCDDCYRRQLFHHEGGVEVWGDAWAKRALDQMPIEKAWPSYDKAKTRAEAIVEELCHGDARLRERFARLRWEAAAKEWRALQGDAVYRASVSAGLRRRK